MAAVPRDILLSRHLFPPNQLPPLLSSRHLLPLRRSALRNYNPLSSSSSSNHILCCVYSGVDGGGGVADEFVSTWDTGGSAVGCEFSALADVLLRIEPLDTSVVGKGVSAPAKDSMKRAISVMLGVLPSDEFDISIRGSEEPLYKLLCSSINTGYTLWNAEYRMSLTRNFESSHRSNETTVGSSEEFETPGKEGKARAGGEEVEDVNFACESLGDLSPAALSYIEKLKLELVIAQKEINAEKWENMLLEHKTEYDNDLLEYLRSLDPVVVRELSQPSSSEVEEIVQQLVQSIHLKVFDGDNHRMLQNLSIGKDDVDHSHVVDQSQASIYRDYLANLLFWCMLLGHHLRGLENRLLLNCITGLV
ncbi:uncharacterized protein [Typha angustifolia]|uniref:uncharacterized protein n=1 Tax=Typha angustifolia TaxID=59011 RepID=UPI003C2C573A